MDRLVRLCAQTWSPGAPRGRSCGKTNRLLVAYVADQALLPCLIQAKPV